MGGRPAQEGRILVKDVIGVRNTGAMLELSVKGEAQPIKLEFTSVTDRNAWCRYIELACEALTTDDERKVLEASRASQRRIEMQQRQTVNEERKKNLSENLGMKFTAEAMASARR